MDATLFFVAQLMCCEVFFNFNHKFTLLDKVASPQMCDLSNLGVLPQHKATRCNSYCKHGLVKQAALEAGDVAVNCQWTTPTGDVQSHWENARVLRFHLSRRKKKSKNPTYWSQTMQRDGAAASAAHASKLLCSSSPTSAPRAQSLQPPPFLV